MVFKRSTAKDEHDLKDQTIILKIKITFICNSSAAFASPGAKYMTSDATLWLRHKTRFKLMKSRLSTRARDVVNSKNNVFTTNVTKSFSSS